MLLVILLRMGKETSQENKLLSDTLKQNLKFSKRSMVELNVDIVRSQMVNLEKDEVRVCDHDLYF